MHYTENYPYHEYTIPRFDSALISGHSPVKWQLLGDKMQLLNNISSLLNLRETQKKVLRGSYLAEQVDARWTS